MGVSASGLVHHNLVVEQQVMGKHRCQSSPSNRQWLRSVRRQAEPGKNPVSLKTLLNWLFRHPNDHHRLVGMEWE